MTKLYIRIWGRRMEARDLMIDEDDARSFDPSVFCRGRFTASAWAPVAVACLVVDQEEVATRS